MNRKLAEDLMDWAAEKFESNTRLGNMARQHYGTLSAEEEMALIFA